MGKTLEHLSLRGHCFDHGAGGVETFQLMCQSMNALQSLECVLPVGSSPSIVISCLEAFSFLKDLCLRGCNILMPEGETYVASDKQQVHDFRLSFVVPLKQCVPLLKRVTCHNFVFNDSLLTE